MKGYADDGNGATRSRETVARRGMPGKAGSSGSLVNPPACLRQEDSMIFLDEEHHGIYYKYVFVPTGREHHLTGGWSR
jgi:hypothetical protein